MPYTRCNELGQHVGDLVIAQAVGMCSVGVIHIHIHSTEILHRQKVVAGARRHVCHLLERPHVIEEFIPLVVCGIGIGVPAEIDGVTRIFICLERSYHEYLGIWSVGPYVVYGLFERRAEGSRCSAQIFVIRCLAYFYVFCIVVNTKHDDIYIVHIAIVVKQVRRRCPVGVETALHLEIGVIGKHRGACAVGGYGVAIAPYGIVVEIFGIETLGKIIDKEISSSCVRKRILGCVDALPHATHVLHK